MSRDWQKDMEVCDKATTAPWYKSADPWPGNENLRWWIGHPEGFGNGVYNDGGGCFLHKEDMEFTVEAREALPYWLQQYAAEKERADKLQEENKRLKKILKSIEDENERMLNGEGMEAYEDALLAVLEEEEAK